MAADAPLEACGLLAGTGDVVQKVIPISNILKSETLYRFSPSEQLAAFELIEREGLELLAIYHSHPKGSARPSPTDVKEAYYSVVYVIWSFDDNKWQAGGYWIENGEIDEVSLDVFE